MKTSQLRPKLTPATPPAPDPPDPPQPTGQFYNRDLFRRTGVVAPPRMPGTVLREVMVQGERLYVAAPKDWDSPPEMMD